MELIFLLIGLAVGIAIGFPVGRLLKKTDISGPETVEKSLYTELQNRMGAKEEQLRAEMSEKAAMAERVNNMQSRLDEQKAELEQLQEKFKNDFKVLAQQVLKETGETFKEQNKTQLDVLITPFKEKLEKFEKKVEETHAAQVKETFSLKDEVKRLNEQSQQLGKEAENLARALKGDVKSQGNWGEVILERILERSGLSKGQEYFVQESIMSDDGRRLQPDVIVALPEGKRIVVDSKVSLVAYDRFLSAETPDSQVLALKDLSASVRAHFKGLSEKNYQNLYGLEGLDFVLLFIPIEGAFAAAVQYDHALVQDAFDKNVVIVSTSTLLATLRTIASIWKTEKQTRNALEIAKQAGDLYDKFAAFADDLVKLGNQMETAKKTYEESMKKLSEGSGNLVRRVDKLRELGVKTSKQIDARLTDRSEG
jgi:DNA recombination protein RmuC